MAESVDNVRDFIAEKQAMLDAEDPINYFDLLGVPWDASTELIQQTYFHAAKQIYPDRLDRLGLGTIKAEAGTIFQALTEAYNVLNDLQRRMEHLRAVESRREGPAILDPEDESRILVHRGAVMLKRKAYGDAEDFFRRALELIPGDAGCTLELAWAIYHNPERELEKRLDEVKELLDPVLKSRDRPVRGMYLMSLYYKAKGDDARQRRYLDMCIIASPRFTEARRDKRLLEMRSKGKAVGLLEKLKGALGGKRKKKGKKRSAGRAR